MGQLRELRGLGWSFAAIHTRDEPREIDAIAGLLALPAPDRSGSLTLARRLPSELWLPPDAGRCST
jgi:hypothetical protein